MLVLCFCSILLQMRTVGANALKNEIFLPQGFGFFFFFLSKEFSCQRETVSPSLILISLIVAAFPLCN